MNSSGQAVYGCLECGAALRAVDEWCPRCLTPVAERQVATAFAAPDAFIGPRLRVNHSRWNGNDVSLGPAGRILATVLVVVLPLLFLFWSVAPFGIVYLVAACPILLAAIWKKTPIRDRDENGPRSLGGRSPL